MDELTTCLLDLLHEVEPDRIPLIVGGGFGIYLKNRFVRDHGTRTLLQESPHPRATNDLDLFLRAELLITPGRLLPLAQALEYLGYQSVPKAKNYQFARPGLKGGVAGMIKIDFLTGPVSDFAHTILKVDARRVRPNPPVGVHAHPTDEAFTLESGLLEAPISGTLTSGDPYAGQVSLPHPFTYLTMKLFAFRDQYQRNNDKATYHALDLYSILATTREEEWSYCRTLADEHQRHPSFIEAAAVVNSYFSSTVSPGILRLQESPYYRPELQLKDFISALTEVFTLQGGKP